VACALVHPEGEKAKLLTEKQHNMRKLTKTNIMVAISILPHALNVGYWIEREVCSEWENLYLF